MHQDETEHDRERQAHDNRHGRAEVQQEDDRHDRYDDRFLGERAFERIHRALDEIGAIVRSPHGHTRRESRLKLGEPLLHTIDHLPGILAMPRNDDSADDFTRAVLVEQSATKLRPRGNRAELRERDRHASRRSHDDVCGILDRADVPDPADDVLTLTDLQQPAADIVVRAADGGDDTLERYTARGHLHRIEIDLVLLDEPADRGHLRDSGSRLQTQLEIPVLQRAKLSEVVRIGLQGVPEDVSNAGPLRSEARRHSFRQKARQVVETFEHARPGPVDIDVVLEDDVDEREAEHRLRPYSLEPGETLEVRRKRIGDLILDKLWRASGPIDVDDHLVVRKIGNRVEPRVADRLNSRNRQQRVGGKNDKSVADRELDDFPYHDYMSIPGIG